MQTITIQLRKILFILLAFTFALGANIAYGQWNNPTATPPADNVAAPVNVGGAEQYKAGNLQADEFHSDNYCDANGNNCVAAGAGSGDPYRCRTQVYRNSMTRGYVSNSSVVNCSRTDTSCMLNWCRANGYDHRNGYASLRSGSSYITVFECYSWDPITICGNY